MRWSEQWVTLKDAAALLSISTDTVRRHMQHGVIRSQQAPTKYGPTWYVHIGDLRAIRNQPDNTGNAQGEWRMNWSQQMARERARQIQLGYTNDENDEKSEAEWDHVYQTWYTRILEAALVGNIPVLRQRLVEFATVAASMGATAQRQQDAQRAPENGSIQTSETPSGAASVSADPPRP